MTGQATRTANHGGVTITIKTSNRTTTDLTVTPREGITVRGPHTLTDDEARALVTRRKHWVYRELNKLCEQAPTNPAKTLFDGETFTILGTPHTLRLTDRRHGPQAVATAYNDPERGPVIDLEQAAASNLDIARRTLIKMHTDTANKWLKENGARITRLTTNPDIRITASPRCRTTWIIRRPTGELSLHWALAQLPTLHLREVLHRALNLHSVADGREVGQRLRTLWLGELALAPQEAAPDSNTCPGCQAQPGTLHTNYCDVARCALTGFQRGSCHPGTTCLTIWSGRWPGTEECEEYGFFYRAVAGRGEPCNATDEGAEPDYNRLYARCVWHIGQQRMILPS
ncbi:YgjP-like metallopeptidase domain-containing protein [Streptomyces erythrochromogenes]|uniref:YgjP-like metallopeptidase domain-containing protein n=1 Tax=Streptomyces erythrochromogenes TaxID=285574 RepID=UPI00341C7654